MTRASAFVTGAAAIASPFIVAFASAAPADAAEKNGLSNTDDLPHAGMVLPGSAEASIIKRFCAASDEAVHMEALLSPTAEGDAVETPQTGAQWAAELIAPMRADPYFDDMLDFMKQSGIYVCKSDTIGAPSKLVKFGDDGMFLQLDPSRAVSGLERQRVPAGEGGAIFAMLTAVRTEMGKIGEASTPVAMNEVGMQSMSFDPTYSLDDNHLKLRAAYIDHILYIAEASLRMKEVAGDSRLHDFLRQFPYPPQTAVGLVRDMEDALRASMDENNFGEITAFNRRAVFDEFFTKPNVFVSLDTTYPRAFLGNLSRNGYNAENGRDAVLPENYAQMRMGIEEFTAGGVGERHNGNYLDGEGRNILTSNHYRLPPFDVDNALAMMQVRHALQGATYSRPPTGMTGKPGQRSDVMEAVFSPI